MLGPVLIVGSGLFGAVCARELTDAGIRCRVVERRNHVGGNCHTRPHPDIGCHEHVYGPHIFHTDAPALWRYVNRFVTFNGFVNRPRVRHGDRVFSFPINLLTLHQLFGVSTPAEAEEALRLRRRPGEDESSVEGGPRPYRGGLYETFVLGYTWKQWNRHANFRRHHPPPAGAAISTTTITPTAGRGSRPRGTAACSSGCSRGSPWIWESTFSPTGSIG